MSFSEFHEWGGGIVWMGPIDLLGLINLGLFAYLLYCKAIKKNLPDKTLQALKQIGGLALAWGAFATLAGFFQALGALEEAKDTIPFPVICGGLKVALITVLYGFVVYMISMASFIIFKFAKPAESKSI
ncbi:MAG: MotA/TolQ/ExbB proton channel family protein [Bacteroidetes bacterium]|nr:MotA/TolQ/ExbB proton channel family protein [Bacteroidota bacterium]